jgi:crossover junction endodeoxyribonuclease RusA
MRAYAVAGKAFVTTATIGPLQRYRNDIRATFGTPDPTTGIVRLSINFQFPRPASHYNTKGEVKDHRYKQPASNYVTKKPDLDKLCRAVLDALTGYAYHDDAQVAVLSAIKTYYHEPMTYISIGPVEARAALAARTLL